MAIRRQPPPDVALGCHLPDFLCLVPLFVWRLVSFFVLIVKFFVSVQIATQSNFLPD